MYLNTLKQMHAYSQSVTRYLNPPQENPPANVNEMFHSTVP